MKLDTYFVQAKEYTAELRLGAIKSDLEESISDAENNNLSYEEFLCRLLQKESDIRKYNLTQSRIKTASFPYKKYLEDHNNALASDIVKYSHGPRCTFFDYECPSDCKLGPVKKLDRRV